MPTYNFDNQEQYLEMIKKVVQSDEGFFHYMLSKMTDSNIASEDILCGILMHGQPHQLKIYYDYFSFNKDSFYNAAAHIKPTHIHALFNISDTENWEQVLFHPTFIKSLINFNNSETLYCLIDYEKAHPDNSLKKPSPIIEKLIWDCALDLKRKDILFNMMDKITPVDIDASLLNLHCAFDTDKLLFLTKENILPETTVFNHYIVRKAIRRFNPAGRKNAPVSNISCSDHFSILMPIMERLGKINDLLNDIPFMDIKEEKHRILYPFIHALYDTNPHYIQHENITSCDILKNISEKYQLYQQLSLELTQSTVKTTKRKI